MSTAELHDREAAFHDDWARDVNPETLDVRAMFEHATALENKWIVKHMAQNGGKKVLDIGGGFGESSVYLAMLGYDVTFTDLSPEMCVVAERVATANGVTIKTVACPAEELGVGDAEFDWVYAANVMHHVQDREAMMKEVNRVLKPGGRIVFWDPLAYNPVINVYRGMADEVRTDDEAPLTSVDLARFRNHFGDVRHREFWIASLSLFIKYYLLDRVHPNQQRYWKRRLEESKSALWWWYPFRAADEVLTRVPGVRMLAWNTVVTGKKAA